MAAQGRLLSRQASQLIAGPSVRYDHIKQYLKERSISREDVMDRFERFSDDDLKQLIREGDFDMVITMYSDSAVRPVKNDTQSAFAFAGFGL